MAKVTIQIPDEVLGLAENPQQVENEVLQAVLAFWIARGMVAKKTMPVELLSRLSSLLRTVPNSKQAPAEARDTQAAAAQVHSESSTVAVLNPGLERLRGLRTLHATSKGFREHLFASPKADEDSDFERIRDLGREPPRWDS